MGEIIDDKLNGYLIPLNNNNLFSDTIKEVFNNHEKRQEISRNSKIKMKKLDIELISKKWQELL